MWKEVFGGQYQYVVAKASRNAYPNCPPYTAVT
jgi:hypothetical protein